MKKKEIEDKLNELFENIQESSLYITVQEKYLDLPEKSQKILKLFLSIAFLAALSVLPYSYIQNSLETEKEFEEDVGLIKDLIKIRSQKLSPSSYEVPSKYSSNQLKQKIQNQLSVLSLLPHQLKSIESDFAPTNSPLSGNKEERLKAQFIKLNFTQIVQVGSYIENLSPFIKLSNIRIEKDEQEEKEYFNVTYGVSILNP